MGNSNTFKNLTIDEARLLEVTGNIRLMKEIYLFALEAEAYGGLNSAIIINEFISVLNGIRANNNDILPINQETSDKLNVIFNKYSKNTKKNKVKIHYIRVKNYTSQGVTNLYVMDTGNNQYALTPSKEWASKFPSASAAEKYMYRLCIDGKITIE